MNQIDEDRRRRWKAFNTLVSIHIIRCSKRKINNNDMHHEKKNKQKHTTPVYISTFFKWHGKWNFHTNLPGAFLFSSLVPFYQIWWRWRAPPQPSTENRKKTKKCHFNLYLFERYLFKETFFFFFVFFFFFYVFVNRRCEEASLEFLLFLLLLLINETYD